LNSLRGRRAGGVCWLVSCRLTRLSGSVRLVLTGRCIRLGTGGRLRSVAFAFRGCRLSALLRCLGRLLLGWLRRRSRYSLGTALRRCPRDDRARKTIVVARLRLAHRDHGERPGHRDSQISWTQHHPRVPQRGSLHTHAGNGFTLTQLRKCRAAMRALGARSSAGFGLDPDRAGCHSVGTNALLGQQLCARRRSESSWLPALRRARPPCHPQRTRPLDGGPDRQQAPGIDQVGPPHIDIRLPRSGLRRRPILSSPRETQLPMTGTIPVPCSTISATRTSSTPCATPS
jgi:hypothetical protein